MVRAQSAVVGRGEELASVAEFLDEVEPPAALVLLGAAGIGKTTLWELAVADARERGQRVLACRPAEVETELSFAALTDLVDPVLDDVVTSLPPPQARALRAALLLEDVDGPALDLRSVAAAFLGVLRELDRDAGVTLAVDDVQWLDRATAGVLEFAARRLGERRVRLLLAQRAEPEEHAPLGLDRALPGRVHRIPVEPLTLGAVHQLLFDRLDLVLARPALRRLHDLSGGNPFFALELGRALQAGMIRLEPGDPLPGNLQELVAERLSALAQPTQQALAVAAALSRPTTALVDETALAPALAAHIVELDGGEVRFVHPLLASAAYARLGRSERLRLHARLADAVADAEERARHLALAAEAPDEQVAAAIEEGAAAAFRRGAAAAAAELGEEALRLTPPAAEDVARRRALLAADYRFQAGDTAAASTLLDRVLADAPSGPVRARLLSRQARYRHFGLAISGGVPLLSEALEQAGADAALRGEIHEGLAWGLMRSDLAAAARHAAAAARLAEQRGDRAALAEALAAQALMDFARGRARPETIRRALELERETLELRVLRHPSFAYAYILSCSNELEAARHVLEELERRAADRGDESAVAHVVNHLALVACLAGDYERGRTWPTKATRSRSRRDSSRCRSRRWEGRR